MRREWLAWGPQGEVARLLTQRGWLVARELVRHGGLRTEIVHQGHDSLVLHGPVDELFDLCTAVAQSLSAPRVYPGVEHPWELCMPVGWGLGRTLDPDADAATAPERGRGVAHLSEVANHDDRHAVALGALHEWKVAPSRADFMEVARNCTGSSVAEPALGQAAGG